MNLSHLLLSVGVSLATWAVARMWWERGADERRREWRQDGHDAGFATGLSAGTRQGRADALRHCERLAVEASEHAPFSKPAKNILAGIKALYAEGEVSWTIPTSSEP